jgi:hypothetical protein
MWPPFVLIKNPDEFWRRLTRPPAVASESDHRTRFKGWVEELITVPFRISIFLVALRVIVRADAPLFAKAVCTNTFPLPASISTFLFANSEVTEEPLIVEAVLEVVTIQTPSTNSPSV